MRYSAVGCIMMLTLSLLTAPLAADVQQPGNRLRVFRIANTVSLGRGVGQAVVAYEAVRKLRGTSRQHIG